MKNIVQMTEEEKMEFFRETYEPAKKMRDEKLADFIWMAQEFGRYLFTMQHRKAILREREPKSNLFYSRKGTRTLKLRDFFIGVIRM